MKLKDFKDIYVCGDIHGNFTQLKNEIIYLDIKDCVLFLAGDIGIGFLDTERFYQKLFNIELQPLCEERNIFIIGVRGNHDDPYYFNGKFKFKNILFVKDYEVIETKNDLVLCIGGGVSIDRVKREEGVSYWKDEIPKYNEKKLLKIKKPSIIVSHTTPRFCGPIFHPASINNLKYWMFFDNKLEKDIEYERKTFDNIFNKLEELNKLPHTWCYGHFHMSFKENINGVDFICCNIGEIIKVKNK